MPVRSSWPFLGALLAAGVLAVHELRYALAAGSDSDDAVRSLGHGYLAVAAPLVGLLTAFAIAHVVCRIATGARGHGASRPMLAGAFAASLLALYTGQELLEGVLASGHADAIAGVFGSGGWIAVPAAMVVGGLLSLAVRLVDAVSGAVSVHGSVTPRAAPASTTWRRVVTCTRTRRSSPLARHLAGRAPPSVLSA